jgi:class 3 adenylate cyclase
MPAGLSRAPRPPVAGAPAPEVRKGLPIVAYLVFGVSALVIASIGGVLFVTLAIATRNTFELLEDRSRLLISSGTQQLRLFLEPAQAQVEALARLIERGRLDPADPSRLFDALQAGLAASPHVRSVVFLDPSGWLMAAIHSGRTPVAEVADWRHDAAGRAAVGEALDRAERKTYWGPPVYLKDPGVTVVNLRRPVVVRGRVRGVLASTITVRELSEFVTGLETELGQNAFVLYEHERVLAHSALAQDFPGLGVERPLPRVDEIGDPVLFAIWREGWRERRLEIEVPGHRQRLGDSQYVYLYQALAPPLDPRWLIGSYFAEEAVDAPLDRLTLAAGLGLLALLAAVIVALLLGRRVSRPIRQLAATASAIRTLDLEDIAPVRRSRLKEIDQAAIAFNAMVRALRVFAVYVPRQIVQGLISRGVAASLVSERRDVTVLFTDIVGFTARTETLGAEQTAAFLNHHFGLLTGCIEAEDGMVDKFIGDAMMAAWNAIDRQDDHALRAVRAARAIIAAVRRDNTGREVSVRLRIGLHSGPAVVGNIGSSSRMNYTMVGDTVNTAQRVEALAKELLPEDDVAVVLSETTVAALPPELPVRALGRHGLRGRGAPLEVFALVV